MSFRAIRLSGIALLITWTVTMVVCHAIPDSIGFVVIAVAFLGACGGWVTSSKRSAS